MEQNQEMVNTQVMAQETNQDNKMEEKKMMNVFANDNQKLMDDFKNSFNLYYIPYVEMDSCFTNLVKDIHFDGYNGVYEHDKDVVIYTDKKGKEYTIQNLYELFNSTSFVFSFFTSTRISINSSIVTHELDFDEQRYTDNGRPHVHTWERNVQEEVKKSDDIEEDDDKTQEEEDEQVKEFAKKRYNTDYLVSVSYATGIPHPTLFNRLFGYVEKFYKDSGMPKKLVPEYILYILNEDTRNEELYPIVSEWKKSNDTEMRVALERIYEAIIRMFYRNGIKVNGKKYVYFCTNPSEYKQGQSCFMLEELYKVIEPKLKLQQILAMHVKGFNLTKYNQYISLGRSSAIPMNIPESVMRKIYVIDIGGKDEGSEVAITYDRAAVATENDSQNFEIKEKYTEDREKHLVCPSDGAAIINAKYIPSYLRWGIQSRLIGGKFMGYVCDVEGICSYENYSNEDCTLTDVSGKTFDIRDAFIVLDKNSCKYYKLYKEYCNRHEDDGKDNYYDFMLAVGYSNVRTDLYVNHFYPDDIRDDDELIKYTKQAMQWMDFTTDAGKVALAEILRIDEAAISKKYDMSNPESVAKTFVNRVGDQAIKYLFQDVNESGEDVSNKITNTSFLYHPFVMYKLAMMKQHDFIKLTQAAHVKGHQLIAFPDLKQYFQVLCHHGNDTILGMSGIDRDGVVAPAFKPGELNINRNPIVSFDMNVSNNVYDKDNGFSKFLSPHFCYIGYNSMIYKQCACDCDGDKLMVNDNQKIIACLKETREKYQYPIPVFNDLDSEKAERKAFMEFAYAVEDGNTIESTNAAISVVNFRNNLVGKDSAVISSVAEKITKMYNDNEDDSNTELIRDIIRHDVCICAYKTQIDVDAQKKMATENMDYSKCILNTFISKR